MLIRVRLSVLFLLFNGLLALSSFFFLLHITSCKDQSIYAMLWIQFVGILLQSSSQLQSYRLRVRIPHQKNIHFLRSTITTYDVVSLTKLSENSVIFSGLIHCLPMKQQNLVCQTLIYVSWTLVFFQLSDIKMFYRFLSISNNMGRYSIVKKFPKTEIFVCEQLTDPHFFLQTLKVIFIITS